MLSIPKSFVLYMCVYSISTTLIAIGAKKKYYLHRVLMLMGMLIPSFFAAVRYNVGTDWLNYYYMFDNATRSSLLSFVTTTAYGTEIGIWIISQLAVLVGGYQVFFFIFAFLTLFIFVETIRNQYADIVSLWIAVFCFFVGTYTSGLNIVRQTLSCCIIFWGFKYIFERKPVLYLFTVFCASMFHASSLLALPIYILWSEKRNPLRAKRTILFLAGASVFVLFSNHIFRIVGSFPGLERFAGYASTTIIGANRSFFLKLAETILVLIVAGKTIKRDPRNNLFIILMLASTILEISGFSNPYIKRLNLFFDLPCMLIFVQLSYAFEQKDRPMINVMICVYRVFFFILSYWLLGHSDVLPYMARM